MTAMNTEDKLNALMNSSDFAAKVSACKSAAELKALLGECGVELSAEQAEKLFSCDPDIADDELLSEVAGGAPARVWNGLFSMFFKQVIKYLKHPAKIVE